MKVCITVLGSALLSIGLLAASPPLNDNFANSTQISGKDFNIQGHNNDASIEPGEPVHRPFKTTYKSIWWTWTAPESGGYTFETTSPTIYPLIGIYTGNELTNLTHASPVTGISIYITAQQHAKYHIMVASSDNSSGGITLKCNSDKLSTVITNLFRVRKYYTLYPSSKGDVLYERYTTRS